MTYPYDEDPDVIAGRDAAPDLIQRPRPFAVTAESPDIDQLDPGSSDDGYDRVIQAAATPPPPAPAVPQATDSERADGRPAPSRHAGEDYSRRAHQVSGWAKLAADIGEGVSEMMQPVTLQEAPAHDRAWNEIRSNADQIGKDADERLAQSRHEQDRRTALQEHRDDRQLARQSIDPASAMSRNAQEGFRRTLRTLGLPDMDVSGLSYNTLQRMGQNLPLAVYHQQGAMERQNDQQDFTHGEHVGEHTFQHGEHQDQRDWQGHQNDLNRQNQRDLAKVRLAARRAARGGGGGGPSAQVTEQLHQAFIQQYQARGGRGDPESEWLLVRQGRPTQLGQRMLSSLGQAGTAGRFEEGHDLQGQQFISRQMHQAGLDSLGSALADAKDVLDAYDDGEIEATLTTRAAGGRFTPDQEQIWQAISGVRNLGLHARFGARLTETETNLYASELGSGRLNSAAALRRGVDRVQAAYDADRDNIMRGASPGAVRGYTRPNPGQAGPTSPTTPSAPTAPAPNDRNIQVRGPDQQLYWMNQHDADATVHAGGSLTGVRR